jgi:formyltetrahydrofolate-dependent phosphoribosylglycinamide formyltransferase
LLSKFHAKAFTSMLNIAVFGSGRGSNFQAILAAIENGTIPEARIVCVISNNSSAGILQTAREHSLPAYHLSQMQYATQEAFVERILGVLDRHGASLIALAGYMKLLPLELVRRFRRRIVNIHPALLPKFGGRGMYGHHVHEAVLAAGERESGATVHLVDEVYDHGAILLQKKVPVYPADTPDTLAERVLAVEHELYPEVIRRIASGELVLSAEAVPEHS